MKRGRGSIPVPGLRASVTENVMTISGEEVKNLPAKVAFYVTRLGFEITEDLVNGNVLGRGSSKHGRKTNTKSILSKLKPGRYEGYQEDDWWVFDRVEQ